MEMKKIYLTLATLCSLAFCVVACSEKEGEEAVPVFDGVIETDAAVDLGLSVLWSSCNIGAETPEAPGDYYACFDSEPVADSISADNFVMKAMNDPVSKILGGNWRLPTRAEVVELGGCNVIRAKYNGKVGYVVTGATGKSIFFPACGYKATGKIMPSKTATFWYDNQIEDGGDIFSITAKNDTTCTVSPTTTAYKYLGISLRPVKALN